MGNIITDRVAYFLKDFPPFSFIPLDEIEKVSEQITVQFCPAGKHLFRYGEEGNPYVYIIRKGALDLLSDSDQLIDKCDPGEIVGVRSVLTGNTYVMSAVCTEESLIYLLPKEIFNKLLSSFPAFAMYFTKGYAAGQAVVRTENLQSHKRVDPVVRFTRDVLTCSVKDSILAVASNMKSRNVGSIIVVNDSKQPLGIVTDTDLRNKVIADQMDFSLPVSQIMSSPVMTIREGFSLSEAQIIMIKNGLHHLVVTDTGTDQGKVFGIISDHDIVLALENHPSSLIKAIKYETDPNGLKEIRDKADTMLTNYLEQELSIPLVSSLITSINDAIIIKAIKNAIKKYPDAAEIEFCWLSLGSEGREEQLLRTDQDNAIVFSGGATEQKVLLQVAEHVNQQLENCGFEKCPADIMARNPKYCVSLDQWVSYFENWIVEPDPAALMNSTIFFDYRSVYGSKKLTDELSSTLKKLMQKNKMFFNFLAKNATQNPPPLGFFKNFLVEKSGEHKNEFDLKKRAMMPLSDVARLLCLDHEILDTTNTIERYQQLIGKDKKHHRLYQDAIEAYELFLRLRALSGIEKKDSGRFLDLNDLSKLQKQMLRSAFSVINDLQHMLSVKYQLAYFS